MAGLFCIIWRLLNAFIRPVAAILWRTFFELAWQLFKFSLVLILTFGLAFLIFFALDQASSSSSQRQSLRQRLSAGLMGGGSFSRFPFLIEIPSRPSTDSNRPVKGSK